MWGSAWEGHRSQARALRLGDPVGSRRPLGGECGPASPPRGHGLLTLSTARILAQMKTSRGRSSRAELCSNFST